MSSAFDNLAAQGVSAIQTGGHGRTFKILTGDLADQQFTGTLIVEPVIDPQAELGSDPREQVYLMVLNPGPALKRKDRIQDGNTVWECGDRESNPADVEAKYKLVIITAQDS